MSHIRYGDIVAVNSFELFPEGRREGVVTDVQADGQVTAEFPQEGHKPFVITAPAVYFEFVRTEIADMFRTLLLEQYGGMDGFLKAQGIDVTEGQ